MVSSNAIIVEREYRYDAPTDVVWQAASNSHLLGELNGDPAYQAIDKLQPDGSVIRLAKGDKFGSVVKEWTEDLGEWVVERYAYSSRDIIDGIFTRIAFEVSLRELPTGCALQMRVTMVPRGIVARIGKTLGMPQKNVNAMFDVFDEMVKSEIAKPKSPANGYSYLHYQAPQLSASVEARLSEMREQLVTQEKSPGLADLLVNYVSEAPELFLQRLRPLKLAAEWQWEVSDVIDICLAATSLGLLSLRWEILCPRCQNGKESADNLSTLPEEVHCFTCNIDYDRNFSANVELIFSPASWLRPLQDGAACMMGPASVPHIKVQRIVGPGEALEINPPFEPGSYRLRTAQAGDEMVIDWDGVTPFPHIDFTADDKIKTAPGNSDHIKLQNTGSVARTFVIEELGWRRDALTGDKAIANTAFRRYCPEQLLAPGDDVRIESIVLMFTDLKGSTSLYDLMGDTGAYNLVRDHFRYLTDIVDTHDGTLVKTMGDAVMAAFVDPARAMEAAIAAQSGVVNFNKDRHDQGMVLKIGLHEGPCIAVTNDRVLDYFGSTVNIAARLQNTSIGDDIVLSSTLAGESGVKQMIDSQTNYKVLYEDVHVKGIDEAISICRLTH